MCCLLAFITSAATSTKNNPQQKHTNGLTMELNKKQDKFLQQAIQYWSCKHHITHEQAEKLKQSYTVRGFNWKKLSQYATWVALACIALAVTVLFADQHFLQLLRRIFSSTALGGCLVLTALAVLCYLLGWRTKRTNPARIITTQAYFIAGVLCTAGAIYYFNLALLLPRSINSLLFLASGLLYGVLGWKLRVKLIWVIALLTFGIWYGEETNRLSLWGYYFWGMNQHLRYVLLGAIMVAISLVLKSIKAFSFFQPATYTVALLYLFSSLWTLSIFGNYADMNVWENIPQIELLPWVLLLLLISLVAIFYGLKKEDATARKFGLVFLFMNLYTRYFEYCWETSHKALFFFLLALSFWFVGRKAETIWNLKALNKFSKASQKDPNSKC